MTNRHESHDGVLRAIGKRKSRTSANLHDAPPARGTGPRVTARERRIDATHPLQTLLSQFFAKLDPNPNSRVDAWIQFLALIAAFAVVIYCVKRHNASADAAMVPAVANPTIFKSLLNNA